MHMRYFSGAKTHYAINNGFPKHMVLSVKYVKEVHNMRVSRVEKFRKARHKKARMLILYTIIIPALCIATGYLITAVMILPAMSK